MSTLPTDPATDDTDVSIEALQQECERLQAALAQAQAEADRLKDLAARAQADLQNAKGRIEREAGEARKFATENVMRRLLPTIDNFQRAFQHLPEELQAHEWVKGVTAIEQSLMGELQSLGLSRMSSLGQQVDARLHEVLQVVAGEADTILEVFEEGYLLHDRVLRPAKVKAGSGVEAQ